MTETGLEKIVRLSAARPGKAGPPQKRYGTPYRSAWHKVTIGDVLEFGQELWKVIPASQHPGFKATAGSGEGSGPGTITTPTVETGTAPARPAAPAAPGAKPPPVPAATAQVQAYSHCLQNLSKPGKCTQLRLPAHYVVTVVPSLP